MATATKTSHDLVGFLKTQHRQVKALAGVVLAAHATERLRAFTTLSRMLLDHEAAEQEIVHPAAQKALTGGEGIVRARLREEADIAKALNELGALDVESVAFEHRFRTLLSLVLAHLDVEEAEEYDALDATLDPRQLGSMCEEVGVAESAAHGHPPMAITVGGRVKTGIDSDPTSRR